MWAHGGEQRAQMTSTRLLTFAALSVCLIVPAPAAATDFGGAPAEPFAQETSGGGVVAPAAEPGTAAHGAQAETPEAAQDTPTTPEGEEQPPEQEENGEQPPSEENGGTETPPDGGEGGEAGGEAGGALPRTGFELAALTAIGLGLLLAGGALWPTSSWPPPRDRLSRSTARR
jgi:hypothetical protein